MDFVRKHTRRWSTTSNGSQYHVQSKRMNRPDSIKMTLGDTTLAFKDGEWKRESETLENTVKDLNYRNEILSSQNQLLEFKLNMVMDMLALAKLDLVQAKLAMTKSAKDLILSECKDKGNDSIFLASWSGVAPRDDSNEEEYKFYASNTTTLFRKKRVLHVENSILEWVGEKEFAANCCYVVGLVDQDKGTVELQEAHPISMVHSVKSQKQMESSLIKEKTTMARNELGQSFGTRKRKKAIKDLEMNQIRVENMQEVAEVIKDSIQETAPSILLKHDLDIQTMADRLIPPCNLEAIDQKNVYNMDDIVSKEVLDSIDHKTLWKEKNVEVCKTYLKPLEVGSFVWNMFLVRLKNKNDKYEIKKMIYLSYLCKWFRLNHKEASFFQFGERHLNNAPKAACDNIRNHFLETIPGTNGKNSTKRSDRLRDKCLIYILCMCFLLNNFKIELTMFAKDLAISVTKLKALAEELGARTEKKKVDGNTVQVATLVIPLKFPQRSRGGPSK